eukprot:c50689_g1_i1.p1 GENE.c50689_g1_i1~~c50689_g1_i1.p1  ORF type:complete len:261 (+),score=56.19 c50689_g1_i1:119-784(+)
MSNSDLTGAMLHKTDLSGSKLCGANVQGADFRLAILTNTDCTNADMTTAWFIPFRMTNPSKSPGTTVLGPTMRNEHPKGDFTSAVLGVRLVSGRHFWAARCGGSTISIAIGVATDGHNLHSDGVCCGMDGKSFGFSITSSGAMKVFSKAQATTVVRGNVKGWASQQLVGLLLNQDTSRISLYVDGIFVVECSLPKQPYFPAFSMANRGTFWSLEEGAQLQD